MNKIELPEKKYVACLDVHAQKSFTPLCSDEIPVPDGHLIVDELNLQSKYASCRIGVKEAHHPDAVWVADENKPMLTPIKGEEVDVTWPAHSIVGTKGFELLDGLPEITEYDYYVWQGVELNMHPYGNCYHDLNETMSTGIIEFLQIRGVTHVVVGGLAADYCVKVTVLQLLRAGFSVVVNLGACRGATPETTEQAKDKMISAGAELVASAKDLIQQS